MKIHLFGIRAFAVVLALPSICAADAVLDWNDVALAQVTASKQTSPDGARAMAIVHVAMFDAVNAIERRYKPYAFDGRAPAGASADAAAASAASAVLSRLFPDQVKATQAAYATSLARLPDGDAKSAGIALGEKVAAHYLALRDGDGTGVPNTYKPRTTPGAYVPTALPVAMEWPGVKPWFLRDGAQFRPVPPPALDSALWARDYDEIRRVGELRSATRTAEQTDVARFWTITGPVAWNPVVRSLAISASLDSVDTARLFALANMAAMDAFIAVFDAKYHYNLWRPVTAIRNGDSDGNDATGPDAAWQPLVDTPMHPEYPCAHCITSAAVGVVLEAQFGSGEVPPVEMTSPTAPGVTRRWTRIADYVREVDNARIWGGIHYRNSTEVGEAMGKRIGELAVTRFPAPAK